MLDYYDLVRFSCGVGRKKMKIIVSEMPEGVETIASSSSQDEADTEDSPLKFRKKRKILRKTRSKNKLRGCLPRFSLLFYR